MLLSILRFPVRNKLPNFSAKEAFIADVVWMLAVGIYLWTL